jgi:hypothetical protein
LRFRPKFIFEPYKRYMAQDYIYVHSRFKFTKFRES